MTQSSCRLESHNPGAVPPPLALGRSYISGVAKVKEVRFRPLQSRVLISFPRNGKAQSNSTSPDPFLKICGIWLLPVMAKAPTRSEAGLTPLPTSTHSTSSISQLNIAKSLSPKTFPVFRRKRLAVAWFTSTESSWSTVGLPLQV